MKKEEIILIGSGGHCTACIDVIESSNQYEIAGIVDSGESKEILGYSILGDDSSLSELIKKYKNVCLAVGQIRSSKTRLRLYSLAKSLGANFPVIVSSQAYVSKHSVLGSGTIVMHGAVVQANVSIGENCIINDNSLIEHDSTIGSHSHISTGAIVNGKSKVGDHSFVGSNSTVIQEIEVGANVVIGAGKVIKKDIKDGEVIK
jgi:sugar O-acyltransferase (sialic acid O-acetyltransferase NeuD family)